MRLVLLNVNTFHHSKHTTIKELKRRRRQRERQKNNVWIGKTPTLHVYISLPSLHDYDVKLPNFTFCGGREHKTRTLFFLFLNFDTVF